jgi:hypothetical protein
VLRSARNRQFNEVVLVRKQARPDGEKDCSTADKYIRLAVVLASIAAAQNLSPSPHSASFCCA